MAAQRCPSGVTAPAIGRPSAPVSATSRRAASGAVTLISPPGSTSARPGTAVVVTVGGCVAITPRRPGRRARSRTPRDDCRDGDERHHHGQHTLHAFPHPEGHLS